jgi:hypothetical protein
MEDAVCPRCDTKLEPVNSVKSHRRDIIYYIIGIIALAITAFFERDLSNYEDMMQGGAVFGALIIGSFFLVLHQGQGRDRIPHQVVSFRYC